jgi:hypothetical protein
VRKVEKKGQKTPCDLNALFANVFCQGLVRRATSIFSLGQKKWRFFW